MLIKQKVQCWLSFMWLLIPTITANGEVPTITANGEVLERTSSFKVLGTWLNEHLKWSDHIKNLSSSCYAVLSTLRKLKNLTPLNVRKQLVESLVTWRKRDYNDVVCYPLPQYLQRKLQQIQNAAVSFVLNKYASESDVLHELKWLPIKERTEHHLLRLVHKSQWDPSFPDYLRVEGRVINRQLRSNQSTNLVISLETGTFQDCSSKLFKSVTRNN
jgi:hypothetical protein